MMPVKTLIKIYIFLVIISLTARGWRSSSHWRSKQCRSELQWQRRMSQITSSSSSNSTSSSKGEKGKEEENQTKNNNTILHQIHGSQKHVQQTSITVNSRVDLEILFRYAGSEVFTAVLLKIQVFLGCCALLQCDQFPAFQSIVVPSSSAILLVRFTLKKATESF